MSLSSAARRPIRFRGLAMQILVNHLTRMRLGRICVAGVDVDTRRHVRPVLQRESLEAELLARYGGPFDLARIVDLGRPRPAPARPHVEDHQIAPARLRFRRNASAEEFWGLLIELSKPRLSEIFGDALSTTGQDRCVVDVGCGDASLGCLRVEETPELTIRSSRDGKPQIRMRLYDGQLRADAGVTDLRLYGDDHVTPDAEMVRTAAEWIRHADTVVLSVGLTRKFRAKAEAPELHWLQVNNIHLPEDPLWRLG